SGDTGGGVGLRLGGVTDVGNAQVDIPAFKRLQVRLIIGQQRRCESIVVKDRVAVSVVLLKTQRITLQNGVGRRSDLRLVEWQGNDLVTAQVADIADVDGEVVTRLPLNVESLVERVGKLVGAIVIGE